jgi:hypothetical protein
MARSEHGRPRECEDHVLARIIGLGGWSGRNMNDVQPNSRGFDLEVSHVDGRLLRVEVRCHQRGDYLVKLTPGADVFAFVASYRTKPWPVYLVGAATARTPASERTQAWVALLPGREQRERTFDPKIWEYLLDDPEMAALERWSLLDEQDPSSVPAVTESLIQRPGGVHPAAATAGETEKHHKAVPSEARLFGSRRDSFVHCYQVGNGSCL